MDDSKARIFSEPPSDRSAVSEKNLRRSFGSLEGLRLGTTALFRPRFSGRFYSSMPGCSRYNPNRISDSAQTRTLRPIA